MDQLKPCPFCGGEAKISLFLSRYGIACTECMGAVLSAPGMTETEAIEAWNRREETNNILQRLEDLKNISFHDMERAAYIRAIHVVKEGGIE